MFSPRLKGRNFLDIADNRFESISRYIHDRKSSTDERQDL